MQAFVTPVAFVYNVVAQLDNDISLFWNSGIVFFLFKLFVVKIVGNVA